MRHLASTSCSLVCASSSSSCLSCSFSPSFSSSRGSADVLCPPGDDGWRAPGVLNRSLQCSQPITLLCMVKHTHTHVSRVRWVKTTTCCKNILAQLTRSRNNDCYAAGELSLIKLFSISSSWEPYILMKALWLKRWIDTVCFVWGLRMCDIILSFDFWVLPFDRDLNSRHIKTVFIFDLSYHALIAKGRLQFSQSIHVIIIKYAAPPFHPNSGNSNAQCSRNTVHNAFSWSYSKLHSVLNFFFPVISLFWLLLLH